VSYFEESEQEEAEFVAYVETLKVETENADRNQTDTRT